MKLYFLTDSFELFIKQKACSSFSFRDSAKLLKATL